MLLFAAVILPCALLVVLSLRMMSQDRELAEKRRADEQRRVVAEIRQQLLGRLERIKLEEVTARAAEPDNAPRRTFHNPAVMLVGWVDNNRLGLPWDLNPTADRARTLLAEREFARSIERGERAELVDKRFAQAAGWYREAMGAGRSPVQAAYARLLLARALAKADNWNAASSAYQEILTLPSDVTDDQGVPLALYAASRLLAAGAAHQAVTDRLRAEAQNERWLSPPEAYLLRSLVDTLVESASDSTARAEARHLQQTVVEYISFLEQSLALQNDFPNLRLTSAATGLSDNSDPVWVSYGNDPWLVGLAPPLGDLPAAIVAVRAEEVFESLDAPQPWSATFPGGVKLLTSGDSPGELLGPQLPGLKVAFQAGTGGTLASEGTLPRSFYLVTLVLVLSVTLFGAYLLWRDVRRDLRVAEMRSQFVSSVSHELKTPLTAIRMFAETLRMGRSKDTETQAEYLDTIVNESERLTRLLNNVLDFSKIERGQKTYRLEPSCLADVVRAAARAMQYPLTQRGFQLRVQTEDSLPAVRADADALEQAILNLLANAMKYSGESREIDLRLHGQNGQAVIQVVDRGVGIAPHEQARIFEKFYRVPTPENQLVPGTGLGLTLVAHIAEAHGGRIQVDSALRRGSTFSIHLPVESHA